MFAKLLYRWFGIVTPLHIGFDNGTGSQPVLVFVHGIGSSSAMWQHVITEIQNEYDVRILSVDLLGFGESPKPDWALYNTKDHARALAATLRKRKIRHCIMIGHSLGALVAIEYAKRHPQRVDSLILCSPPLYTAGDAKKWLPSRDVLYKKLYQTIRAREQQVLKMGQRVRPNAGFMLNESTLPAFMKSLESSIENQTSLEDLQDITCATTILYGRLDPVVISKNFRMAADKNPLIRLESFTAGHEIGRRYAAKLRETVKSHISHSW